MYKSYQSHTKNTVRYYLLLALALVFLFFTNDFGLTDVQKTAIVMAVGVDREEDTFIVTSQIAIPESSMQGQSSKTVQLVSRGKTIAQAFEEINAKTGWYPKLIFCNLILLGEKTAKANAFDALDYFLRDEYLSDNCYVATCHGLAKDILDTTALVDPSSSTAIQKILSPHAERVGTVMPNTLKDFAIGYFSDSRSGFLPVVKKQPQQEHIPDSSQNSSQNSAQDSSQNSSGKDEASSQSENGESGNNQNGEKPSANPVFSAGETALFVNGKWVETLQNKETFALGAVLNKLRLAAYSIERDGKTCSLTIKQNNPKISLHANREELFTLHIEVSMFAGMLDFSKAQTLDNITDVGDVPKEYFTYAAKKLESEIKTTYEKCKAVECDLFGVRERLIKYERRRFHKHENTAFQNTRADVTVRFRNLR